MKNYECTHIEGIYPGETLCEIRIVKGLGRKKLKVVKYPDHPADCPECLIIWHEDKERDYVIHNEETNNPSEEELNNNLDEWLHELAKKEEKRKVGRPKKGNAARDQVKPIRWTAEQWAEVETAADQAGMNPSAFIRAAVLSQAREMKKPR